MLGQCLNQRHETALCIEPSVRAQLPLEWLQALYNSADSEIVIALGAVEGTNDKVDDTEVEHWLRWLFDTNSIFLLLNALHQFLSVGVLTRHDVANAQIRQDNGSDLEEVVHLSAHERLVVPDGVTELVFLHEEDVCNIQLPGFMLTAKLGRLSENFFDLLVVCFVPVHLGLHHEHWNILIQRGIILLQSQSDLL